MNKRGRFGSMSERVAASRGIAAPPADLAPVAPPPAVKPCWVTDEHGRLPGLLLEWRKVASGTWQGRVVRPVLAEGGWVVVEEWVPARALEQAPAG